MNDYTQSQYLFGAASGRMGKPKTRAPRDFYPTPAEASRAVLAAERERLRQLEPVWECAAGDGAIMLVADELGIEMFGTDIEPMWAGIEVLDFLATTAPLPGVRGALTNPPFAIAASFVEHALAHLELEYLALLLPATWVWAARRAPLLELHPIARFLPVRWRVDFSGEGAPPSSHAWHIWDRTHRGPTEVHYLDRPEEALA